MTRQMLEALALGIGCVLFAVLAVVSLGRFLVRPPTPKGAAVGGREAENDAVRPIAPRLLDLEEVAVAEDQPEFAVVTAAIAPHDDGSHSMYVRWTLTSDERARVALGEDVYISFPFRVAPHHVSLLPEWARADR